MRLSTFTRTKSSPAPFRHDCASAATKWPADVRSCRPGHPLITHYYGGVYFSYSQAVQMDAILSGIPQDHSSFSTDTLKVAALLSTASAIANTVGKHFAQPMKLRNTSGGAKAQPVQRTIKDRGYDAIAEYRRWLTSYLELDPAESGSHKVVCADFRQLLRDRSHHLDCVYADPPYTIDHYSRFYHVLETIARRDYPLLDRGKRHGRIRIPRGLYRAGRHQSPFCIPSKVSSAFRELFSLVRQRDVPLILSYSPYESRNGDRPRLMTLDSVRKLASSYFRVVEVVQAEKHSHRRLHSTKKSIHTVDRAECFVLCSPR